MKNILLMAVLITGTFSLKANEGYSGHYFTNYNVENSPIASNIGTAIDFDDNGDFVYSSEGSGGGGLDIALRQNDSYTWSRFDDTGSASLGVGAAISKSGNIIAYADSAVGLYIGSKQSNGTYSFSAFGSDTSFDGVKCAISNTGLVGYSSFQGLFIGQENNTSWSFTSYSSDISSSQGTGVAFNNNGDVAYVSSVAGLDIGTKTDTSYTWANYNASNPNEISNNTGTSVAFDKDGDVGYSSNGGGLDIGTKQSDGTYSFTNYGNGVVTDLNGEGVAFDNNGDVGYVSGGGLDIGTKNSDDSYSFTHYGAGAVRNIDGQGVAFDNNGDVGYVSGDTSIGGGGIDIGKVFNANLNNNDISYSKMANGNYSISNLQFNLNLSTNKIITQNPNKYVQVIVTGQNTTYTADYVYYITAAGVPIPNPEENVAQSDVVAPSDGLNFTINQTIMGDGGFQAGQNVEIQVAIGDVMQNDVDSIATDTYNINIPNDDSGSNATAVGLGVGLGLGLPLVGAVGVIGGLAYYAKVNNLSFVEASKKIGSKFKFKK